MLQGNRSVMGEGEIQTVKEERVEECEAGVQQQDVGLDDSGLALLEFLLPKGLRQQPAPGPLCSLLSGPPRCGKTSLLLQLASNLAGDPLARVVFICKPHNFEHDHIYLSPKTDSASQAFERVQIKYVSRDEDLCKYFAAFHLHLELPSAVIVDNFLDYFSDGSEHHIHSSKEKSLVKTLALSHNAMEYASSKAAPGVQCRLVFSDTYPGDGPRLLYIFKRWLSQVYDIKALEDPSAFTLKLQDIKTGQMGDTIGRFSLAHQGLHFDGLEARSQVFVKSEPVSE